MTEQNTRSSNAPGVDFYDNIRAITAATLAYSRECFLIYYPQGESPKRGYHRGVRTAVCSREMCVRKRHGARKATRIGVSFAPC